jgi:hypothetical protein
MTTFNIRQRLLLFLIGMGISFSCFSQNDSAAINQPHVLLPTPAPPEEIFYRGSAEGGGGELIPITNRALRLSLNGVYDAHLSVNYVLAPHIYAGLELEDAQLGNAFVNAPYNTLMTMYNIGAKIGYYSYMQNDFLFCYSISAGPSLIVYSDAPIPSPRGGFRVQSFFARPDILAGYRVNDELRVGIDISILMLGYRFDPSTTGITPYLPGSYDPSKDNNTLTTCISLGFGLYWAFHESKR